MDQESKTRGAAKVREGVVVSNSMQKTVVVETKHLMKHKVYGKFIRKSKKFYAHDELGACAVGDTVRIVETRPLSKMKRWKVKEILVKAQ